jgi:hypothetical protein
MNEIKDGGPPRESLRDYFAAAAMSLTIPAYVNLPESANLLAKRCYAIADAMLAERQKGKP